jgi:hypothetical protein
MQYRVGVEMHGSVEVNVEADSWDEARELAEEQACMFDHNRFEDVYMVAVFAENEENDTHYWDV